MSVPVNPPDVARHDDIDAGPGPGLPQSAHHDLPHESARGHVTGAALYTDDLVGRFPGLLHAWPVMAPHAHARVTGIDLSEKALGVAQLHRLESGVAVDYRLIAAEALALETPAHFDIVTCMEMLEHVPDPGSIIQACAVLAKPGGTLVFSTLNRNPKSYVFAILGAEYLLRLLPRGTHDWTRFLRPSELAAFARRAGLDLDQMIGMTYNPLTRVYRLEADTSVNYLVACRKPPHAG